MGYKTGVGLAAGPAAAGALLMRPAPPKMDAVKAVREVAASPNDEQTASVQAAKIVKLR